MFSYTNAFAEGINFDLTVQDRVVSLGETTQLTLRFDGVGDISAPELPDIEGFETRYVGPSTSISIINGQVSQSVEHIYTLIPVKLGLFTIGPMTVIYKGKEYASNPVKVEVVESGAQLSRTSPSASRDERRWPQEPVEDITGRIYLTIQVPRQAVYVNEVVPVTLKLYVNRMGLRDIEYPDIAHEGFSIGKYEQPRQYREKDYNDNIFDVIEFKTSAFATGPGEFQLGPASVNATKIDRKKQRGLRSMDDAFGDEFFDNFFERYETHPIHLASQPVGVTVLPFPEEGKPDSFKGTIGEFNFDMTASPTELKAGDPITLTMKISGNGNFDTVTAPVIDPGGDFKVYDPTVTQQSDREKVFEQVIIPKTDAITQIPKVNFSFFNPARKIYQVISKGLIPIKVTKPDKEEELKIVESGQGVPMTMRDEKLGRDIIYIKESPGEFRKKGAFLFRNNGYLAAHLLPFMLLLSLFAIHKRSEKLRTDVRYARRMIAPKKAKAGIRTAGKYLRERKNKEFYDAVFKTVQEYIGDKYHIAAGGITIAAIDEVLGPSGVKPDVLERLRRIFSDCDMARYAASQFGRDSMEKTFADLSEIIDAIERHRG